MSNGDLTEALDNPLHGMIIMETRTNQTPRYHRIELIEKLPATINGQRAVLVDVSLSGALVAHQNPLLAGSEVVLHFDWRGEPVDFRCEIKRSEVGRVTKLGAAPVLRSGVHFTRWNDSSRRILREMITDLVTRALDEQKANSRGVPAVAASSYQTGQKTSSYLTLRLIQGAWKQATTSYPAQPLDGFTVSTEESPAQIAMLCTAYKDASFEDRKMIRNMAALTLGNEQGIPTRRYNP